MKIFLFASPYQYYIDNLIPLAKYCATQKCFVMGSYQLVPDDLTSEMGMLDKQSCKLSQNFLNGKFKPDCVILTQPWWYQETRIVDKCRKTKIPFYIVDHAPPMIRYTETKQKQQKSHLYRADLRGAKNFFAYGPKTIQIMKEVGCKSPMISMGSSRLEEIIQNISEQKSGYVLFDTSHRMEDQSLVNKFLKFVKRHPEQQFLIKEHSRSPKWYRESLNFPNVKLANECPESELFKYSNFIFTFPSSAMLVPALLKKNIFTLYQNHYCEEAKSYYNRYLDIFPELGREQKSDDYSIFLTNNVLYREEQTTNQRIYQYLLEDLK